MSQAIEIARKGSIFAAAKLYEELNGKIPFPTSSAKPRTVEGCMEIYYSSTIDNEKELESVILGLVGQVAAGVRADYPEGVSFAKYPKEELDARFPDAANYRAEVMGVAIAFSVRLIPEAKRAQLTLIVEMEQWLPKSF